MSAFTLETQYVAVSCGQDGCHQVFAMSLPFYRETQRTRSTWYCPSGHPRVWNGKTDEQKLKDAEARETALRDQLAAAIRDAEDTRVALLRDRQRFANGVCPCCNRSFENVARHIRGEHPDYDITKVKQQAQPVFKCSCGDTFRSLQGLRIHQGRRRRDGWDRPNASRWAAHLTKVGAGA